MGLALKFGAAMLVGTVVWCTPVVTQASPIGFRFSGTVDLSAFGAPSASTFDGTVTWDPEQACGPGGGGEGDFPLSPLDAGPPCVTADVRINSIDFSDFDLEPSRLMLFADGIVLQLWWFGTPVDLDGGAAADVRLVELGLWQPLDASSPVFPDIRDLPPDLSFLSRVVDRFLVFSSPGCFAFEDECIQSTADTLTVVPEPASTTLLLVAFVASSMWKGGPGAGRLRPVSIRVGRPLRVARRARLLGAALVRAINQVTLRRRRNRPAVAG